MLDPQVALLLDSKLGFGCRETTTGHEFNLVDPRSTPLPSSYASGGWKDFLLLEQ